MEPIWAGKCKYDAWAKGRFGIGCEEAFYGSMSCTNKNGYGSAGQISIPMSVIDALMKEAGISKFNPTTFRIYIEEIEGDEDGETDDSGPEGTGERSAGDPV